LPSTVTVHYPFHALHNRSFEVLAWPRRTALAVTVRHPDGKTLKLPLWMVEPMAAQLHMHDQIELSAGALPAVAALLEAHAAVVARNPPEQRDAAADQSRSRSGRR